MNKLKKNYQAGFVHNRSQPHHIHLVSISNQILSKRKQQTQKRWSSKETTNSKTETHYHCHCDLPILARWDRRQNCRYHLLLSEHSDQSQNLLDQPLHAIDGKRRGGERKGGARYRKTPFNQARCNPNVGEKNETCLRWTREEQGRKGTRRLRKGTSKVPCV